MGVEQQLKNTGGDTDVRDRESASVHEGMRNLRKNVRHASLHLSVMRGRLANQMCKALTR